MRILITNEYFSAQPFTVIANHVHIMPFPNEFVTTEFVINEFVIAEFVINFRKV